MILEFTFEVEPSIDWPSVNVIVNGQSQRQVMLSSAISVFTISCPFDLEQNTVTVDYFSKTPQHTLIKNGNIVQDESVRFVELRFDDILVEPWVWNQGIYCPRYFKGFSDANPGAPVSISADRHWFFPGTYNMGPWPPDEKFWWWYRDERRRKTLDVIQKIDGNREDSHMGSLDNYQEEIDKIKRILGV